MRCQSARLFSEEFGRVKSGKQAEWNQRQEADRALASIPVSSTIAANGRLQNTTHSFCWERPALCLMIVLLNCRDMFSFEECLFVHPPSQSALVYSRMQLNHVYFNLWRPGWIYTVYHDLMHIEFQKHSQLVAVSTCTKRTNDEFVMGTEPLILPPEECWRLKGLKSPSHCSWWSHWEPHRVEAISGVAESLSRWVRNWKVIDIQHSKGVVWSKFHSFFPIISWVPAELRCLSHI